MRSKTGLGIPWGLKKRKAGGGLWKLMDTAGLSNREISQSRIRDLSACHHSNRSQVRAHVPSKR